MNKKIKNYVIILLILILVSLAIIFNKILAKILSLLILAAIEAYLFYPFVKIIEKRIPRKMAILLGFLIIAVILCSSVILLIPIFVSQIKNLVELLPSYIDELEIFVARIPFFNEIFKDISFNENIIQKGTEILSFLSPTNLVSLISSTFLVPVIVYYILNERERLKEISLFLLPGKLRTPAIYIFREINRQLKDYVLGEIIIILTVSFLMSVVLGIFGFRYWLLLGIFMGIFNVIPYVGPILGSVPILFAALLQDKIILALILILFVQQIDNLIIHPRIISDSVKIHPVTVLLCVVAGNTIGNIIGMVLAIPLYIILRILFREFCKYFSERKHNFPQFSKI